MFSFLVVYFCLLQPAHRQVYSTFSICPSKLKRIFTLLFVVSVYCSLFLLCRSSLSRFRTLCTVFGTSLRTACYAGSIQCTANDVVTYTRKVLYTTATYQYDGVFLQVVTFTRNVGVYFLTVGQTYTSYFTHS